MLRKTEVATLVQLLITVLSSERVRPIVLEWMETLEHRIRASSNKADDLVLPVIDHVRQVLGDDMETSD